MISKLNAKLNLDTERHTLWGLTPTELHDRFWAARQVQVVRPGTGARIATEARYYLLLPRGCLVFLDLWEFNRVLGWRRPKTFFVRVRDRGKRSYGEKAVADHEQRFLRFERCYRGVRARSRLLVLTSDPGLARRWQLRRDHETTWREIKAESRGRSRVLVRAVGRIADASNDAERMSFTRQLVQVWKRPDRAIGSLQKVDGVVWTDRSAKVDERACFAGPAWVGAGRRLEKNATVLGPAILWDNPEARPEPPAFSWKPFKAHPLFVAGWRMVAGRHWRYAGKRIFDVLFATLAIIASLPFYPPIMLAILLEDGWPFFFSHPRESRGGRVFPCVKFRTMKKDAEALKAKLLALNKADGPQVNIPNDPRVLWVGRILRKTKLDELPQFFNVLLGHMSVVGPRPSPYDENQCCPAWREARLSVRPGITGLWQVERTRTKGLDFQEWIKYDIEYAEKLSALLDLRILLKTVKVMVLGR